MMQLS